MKTVSASPAEAKPRTLVWDAPVRVFHWLLAASFAVAWLTAESERWQLVHISAGYTMAGLVAFRLLWGVVGTRHARFGSFVRGPRAVLAYLGSILRGRPEHHVGHNPAGALAILALIALAVLTAATGWASLNELGGHAIGELHEGLASAMLGLVAVHVAAVIASSLLHGENLVAAMIHGRKPVPRRAGIRRAWGGVAALLLACVLGFWAWQWQSAPGPMTAAAASHPHEDED
jgi:cytochrome b